MFCIVVVVFFPSCLPLLILLTGSCSLWCPPDCARWRGGAPLCGEGGEPFNSNMRHFCSPLSIQSSEANRTVKANEWAKRLVEVEVQNKTKQEVCNSEGWGQGWSKLGRPPSCRHEMSNKPVAGACHTKWLLFTEATVQPCHSWPACF